MTEQELAKFITVARDDRAAASRVHTAAKDTLERAEQRHLAAEALYLSIFGTTLDGKSPSAHKLKVG